MPVRILVLLILVGLRTSVFGATPRILLQPGSTPKIEASGNRGDQVRIEAASKIESGWDLLGSLVLTNESVHWPDLWAGDSSRRFYRVVRSEKAEAPVAENFRLIDQRGKSRELYYYWNAKEVKAFVLIFTANGCSEIEKQLPAINELRGVFESKGIVFWMINSNPSDTRDAIAAEATKLGIAIPIFHDRAQTVRRIYQARAASEVVCISRENLSIFYRGAMVSGEPPQEFLREALTAFLDGKEYNIRETKAPGCDLNGNDSPEPNYARDIAPILQSKCVTCHSPGNVAPWAMTNHAVVRAYGPMMIEQISSKKMPPWHADPEYGHFKNDISLNLEQEQKLIRWLSAGSPRGEGADPLENVPPPAPKWPLELGEPDLIIRAPEQLVKATGVEPYRYIYVDTGLKDDVWLRAAIVRPTNPKVVHHYLVWEGASNFQMAAGLAGYVPGTHRGAYPEGVGVLLHGNTPLTFNLHYTPDGEDTVDQPELALWFHKTPPAKSLITLPLLNLGFTIPAGAREYEVTARLPFVQSLPYAGTLYAMSPHMHVRGSRMRFEVIYPDNKQETLLSVPNYDFHWQTTYELATPKKIPAGSKLIITGAFDNSELNDHNPDPASPVRWGEQSWEEMFIGYFEFTQD